MCCKAPVLAYYDVDKEVTIQCDASKEAVGAVLLQEGRPVAYASLKLRESEINWAPIEKECRQLCSVHRNLECTFQAKRLWFRPTISP